MKTSIILDTNVIITLCKKMQCVVLEDIEYIDSFPKGRFFVSLDSVSYSVFDTIVDNLVAYNAVFPCTSFRSYKSIKRSLGIK